jgi:hypothetical protein
MLIESSLRPQDGQYVLAPLPAAQMVSVAEKERLIQSGQRHYGQMLSPEKLPPSDYLALYRQALVQNGARLAADLQRLAAQISAQSEGEIVLLSLARGGTPLAAVLAQLLRRIGRTCAHYSLSVIRDYGLDTHALAYVQQRHDPQRCWFVDGWTAKGVIRQTLATSHGAFPLRLAVVADLAGVADVCATQSDYLLPSMLLNATVSGLVSRTVWNADGLHQAVFYQDWREHDHTAAYIDTLLSADISSQVLESIDIPARKAALQQYQGFQIKPGIGEASRALLRRQASRLILARLDDPQTAHLYWLAQQKNIRTEHDPHLPWAALAIIDHQEIFDA